MEKILVTGGSGFIGTNLVEFFFERRYCVLNIDIEEPKKSEYNFNWKKIDITDKVAFENAVVEFQPDYIVHLAARTDLNGKSIEDYAANTVGVENLMHIIKKLPDLKKVIVAASMLVCSLGYQPKHQRDYHPTTFYGESKVITENIVWGNKPKCDWAIIRPTSIWGPWFGEPYRNFFDMVKSKHYFHIGHKSCTKTYGYIGNAVYQIKSLLFTDTYSEDKKTFYIGDYEPVPIEEWGNQIATELGIKIPRVPFWMMCCAAFCGDLLRKIGISFPMTSFRLKNMTTDNVVNLENTRKIVPKLPFERVEGIRKTLQWMENEK